MTYPQHNISFLHPAVPTALVLITLLSSFVHPQARAAEKIRVIAPQEYTSTVTRELNRARSEITVAMYLISYDPAYPRGPVTQLLNSLIDAHKRGVKVTVVLDKNADFRNTGTEDTKNEAAFAYLKKGGVPVSYDSLKATTHTKAIVIDHRHCIVGSTNWTYSALVKNHETSVLVSSPEVARKVLGHLAKIPQ